MMDKISMFSKIANNYVTRKALKGISCFCNSCNKNRIEVALELYLGIREKDDACFKCRMAEQIIAGLIKRGAKAFDVSKEEMKKKFSDVYWRKGLASVIKGIAYFGVRKPFVPGAPFQVVWDVTYACNLKCKHCYATAGMPLKDELTTEEAKETIDKLDKLGLTVLAFSGGEPLVRKDIFELFKYASGKGLYVAVATNGTLISKETAKRMKKSGVRYVQISLDGKKETHESFRGIYDCFDKTIQGIKNCVEEGFFVNISMTVTKHNYMDVDYVIYLCEDLGVDWFMHYNFVPVGRGKDIVAKDLSPEERENLLKKLYKKNGETKIRLLSTAPQFARIGLECEDFIPTHFYNINIGKNCESNGIKQLAEFIGGCGAGRFYLSIKANGDIQPCVFFPLKLGNIREMSYEDLENFWKSNKVLEKLRNKDLIEGCKDCEYRYYCGGCRARAYNYFGDYLKPDSGCVRNKKYWEKFLSENAN